MSEPMNGEQWEGRLIWEAKIGIDEMGTLPSGADFPMRQILRAGFIHVTGKEPDFLFSGWNAQLTKMEKECIKK